MADAKCPVCTAATADGLLCDKCLGQCRRWLRTVRDMWPEMTSPGIGSGGLDRGSASADRTPLPVNLAASDDSDDVRSRLVGLVRMLDMGDSQGLADWPPIWCVWIDQRAERIRIHGAVEDIVAEIRHCQRLVLRHAGRGTPDDLFCGYCTVCGTGLYAKPGAETVLCRECKRLGVESPAYGVKSSRAGLRTLAEDYLVTKGEAAAVANVKRQTLDTWIKRGRIIDHSGRVRLGDVLDTAEGMRRRAAG